jgi:alkylation response protein AidB-like acyl-CoA dehydrogenase
MDVRLSAEQRSLRESAAQLVDRLGPRSVADLDDIDRRTRIEAAIAAAGWRELRCADKGDEPLASTVEVAIVAEELGRGLADTAFIGPTLAAELRRLAGADVGTSTEVVLLSADLAALSDGEGSGIVMDGEGASTGLLQVRDRLVSSPLPGLDRDSVDLTRLVALAVVTRASVVGDLTADRLTQWNAFGLAIACADLVGVMRGTIELARSYACTREQYGAAIGSFQAVQHLLADAHVALEGSRSTALHAAWAVDNLAPDDALAAAAGAKAYCARAAMSVCETSIQVHGGIGNTWECLAHVYLRRALVSADLLGNVGPSLQRVLDHRLGAA